MATTAVNVKCEGCSCNISYYNNNGVLQTSSCSNNSSITVYANKEYSVTLSQIYAVSGYTTPITFYYNRSNGSGYNGSETLSGTTRTISSLSFGRTFKLVATSSGGSTIEAHLKCGQGIASYRLNDSNGSQVAKITTKSSYTTLTLTKGATYKLGNIVYEDGWSGIRWYYNSSSSHSSPNTSTTNPDYQLGSNYDRWGYFEATDYTDPTVYYTCYARAGTGVKSATCNSSTSAVSVEEGSTAQFRCSLNTNYDWGGWYYTDTGQLYSRKRNLNVSVYEDLDLTAKATYNPPSYTYYYRVNLYIDGNLSDYTNRSATTASTGYSIALSTCQGYFTIDDKYEFSTAVAGDYCTYSRGYFTVTSTNSSSRSICNIYYLTKRYLCKAVKGIGIATATINGYSSSYVDYGGQAQYRCTLNDGYTWAGWYEDDMLLSTTKNLNLTIYTSRTLEAVATLNSYTCQAYKGTGIQNATVNGYTTAQTVNYGSTATFVATVATGYDWLGWYDADDNLISSSQTYKPTVTKNLYLTARAGIKQFNCTATAGTGTNSATINNYYTELNVDYGASVTFRCSVNTGYTFDGWYSGSTRVSTSQTYTVSSVTSNQRLTSKATLNSYVVRATAGTGISAATVNDNSSITLNYGDTAQFRCSVRTGYQWDGWYSGSSRITTTQNYDWTVTSARTLEARATLIPHNAHAYSTGFGCCFSSVSVNKSSFVSGDSLTFTANLNTGYVFRGWYNASGTRVSTNRSYTFTAGDSDYTLYARADFAWTYDKSSGSSIISAEEFRRLQTYITQRNGASFSSQPNVGDAMTRDYYNMLKEAIGTGSTVIKFQVISAALLNALRDNANNL